MTCRCYGNDMHGSRQELDDNEQHIQPRTKQERGGRAWYGNVHPRGSRSPGAARSGGVPVTNAEGAASSTISTLGKTATRRVGSNGSSLLPECRQRNSPVLGARGRYACPLLLQCQHQESPLGLVQSATLMVAPIFVPGVRRPLRHGVGRLCLRRPCTPYVIQLRCLFKDLSSFVIHAFQFMRFSLRPDELGDHRR
jgi:hypothetical protein